MLRERYIVQYQKHGFGFWAVARKQDGALMGMCGLIKRDTLDDADIGFAFLPAFRGQGYALEAARASLDYAKSVAKLPRVVAIAVAENTSSLALLEKIGLRFERHTTSAPDSKPLVLYSIEFDKH
jgi:[ribosomal protein S5]-alanine N-acetyltransferase